MSMEHHEGGHQPGQVDPHLPSFVQVVPPQPVQFSQPVPVAAFDPGYNRGQVSTYNFSNVVERRNAPIPPPVALFTGSSSSAQYTLNSVLAEDSGPKHSLWQRYLRVVSVDNQARKLSIFIGFMAVVFIFKLHISYGAESMALLASAYYTLFTLLALTTSLVALVANKQRSTLAFSYGYDRYELLMGFASGTLLVFVSLYVLFEGFEHILEPHEVNTNKLMLTSLFGMVAHVLAVVLFNDQIKLRTELATHSRMKSVEGLMRQLVTDVMPDLLLFVTSIIFYVQPIYWLESLIGWVIALHAMWTVIPYCVESGRILIQSVPQSIQYILEDTIRDATTVDGVLEVRRKKSHFWTFAPGVFVGTLHVRVKQDADVQQVLQQLNKLFSPIIQHLTIQVQKDDWGHGHKHDHQPAQAVVD